MTATAASSARDTGMTGLAVRLRGVTKADIDYRRAYSTQFVNKGVGLDLRPKP